MRNRPLWRRRTNTQATHSTGARLARFGVLAALLGLNLAALLGSLLLSATLAHADSPGSVNIIVPKPASKVARGPVGANVSISGVGTPKHSYQLGYAPAASTCAASADIPSAVTVADSDGKFAVTFLWPSGASAIGASYSVCALDKTDPTPPPAIESSQLFQVAASGAPTITLSQPVATPVSGVTPVPTPESGTFYAGSSLQIVGANFVPGKTPLLVYVTATEEFRPGDLASRPLATADGGATTPDDAGAFTAVVVLPGAVLGNLYIHVVSNDGTATLLPALIATQPLVIKQKPTPTPPTPTATPKATPSPTPIGASTGAPSLGNIFGVLGLGCLSVVLFILGIGLIMSASGATRNTR